MDLQAQRPQTSSIQYILSPQVLKRSLMIALVVGFVLSLVNQLDILLHEPMTLRIAAKIFMNFLVPFIVSSVSALLNRR